MTHHKNQPDADNSEPQEAGGPADGGNLEPTPDSPWQRILDAAARNRGVRLSVIEVNRLVADDSPLTIAVDDTLKQVIGDGPFPDNAGHIAMELRNGFITTAQARRALRQAMK
ncbi:MAG: hypothetical protein AAF663_06355 [Planctomycetota bacterium]